MSLAAFVSIAGEPERNPKEKVDDTGWGTAVEGVQCRLRAEKRTWKLGEPVMFAVDVRNQGRRNLNVYLFATDDREPDVGVGFEVDGKVYRSSVAKHAGERPFGPGMMYTGIAAHLDKSWRLTWSRKVVPLRLQPGKHKVRALFMAHPFNSANAPVSVVSNPVEIEIEVADDALPQADSAFRLVKACVVRDFRQPGAMFDLDVGKFHSLDRELESERDAGPWFVSRGVDLTAIEESGQWALLAKDMIVVAVVAERWKGVTVAQLRNQLGNHKAKPKETIRVTGQLPVTFGFQTREGAQGLLHAVGINDDPQGINIRYKLVAGTGRAPAPQPEVQRMLPLWEQIAQRKDKPLREEALAGLRKLLSGSAGERAEGLIALLRVHDVPFDRAPYLPLVREALGHEDGRVREYGARTIAPVGGDTSDLPRIIELAADPSATVRAVVGFTLFALDPKGEHPGITPTLLRLLDDADKKVVRDTFRSFWGHPLATAVETRLSELSRDPRHKNDVVYYALSTRPLVRRPVAERLIEVMDDAAGTRRDVRTRASWGLSHHNVANEAHDIVVDAFIRNFDESLDRGLRDNCLWGLAAIGTDRAVQKLRDIAAHAEQPWAREKASEVLRRFSRTAREPAAPAEDIARDDFGPVTEREVSTALDLDSGKTAPLTVWQDSVEGMKVQLLAGAGVDLYVSPLQSNLSQLMALNLALVALGDNGWPTPAVTVTARIDAVQADVTLLHSQALIGPAPKVYAFKTAQGNSGILQFQPSVVQRTEVPHRRTSVKIRYKLVR